MKRLLSLVVAFAMILSMVPNAFATETTEDQLPSDMETIGSLDNPEVLAELGSYSVTLASGDTDGYYYAYAAVGEGTVSAWIESVSAVVVDDNETEIVTASTEEEAVTGTIALTNKTTGATGTEVAVSEGDIVLIQVTSSAAADVSWYGNFTYYAGHETNPIWLEIGENVLTIPAGATVYYCGRFGGMVMSAVGEGLSLEHNGTTYALTAEAQEFACAQASMWEPSTFVITNAGETELTCTLTVSYPLGSMENPAALELGYNYATITEGSQGYYYTWTAEEAGTLSIEMPSDMGWAYAINNMTTYVYGDTQWSDSDPVVNPGTIEVAAGDEIQIMVNTYDAENPWTAPAGELAVYASFTAVPGTVNNPLWLEIGENVLTIPAGATVYYCGRFGGMVMSAVGEGLSLEHNGTTYALTAEAQEFICAQASMWEPSTFVITNAGEEDLTCTLTVTYPLGSMENPAALELGYNYATITEGSQGYYYTWTAEEAGTLSIEMPSDMGWAYAINNMTTYVYGDTQWSDSDPVVNPGTIEVAAGDEIQIMVNTYDAENPWTAPAGELAVYASFTAVPGTVNNPIWLEIGENVLTIPAGATVYYCGRFGGMVMSAVGEGLTLEHNGTTYTLTAEAQEFICAQASMWEPSTFVITNAGEEDLTCTLTVTYPLGSMENPAALELGYNYATITEGSQGYYYTWTAEEAGTLSIEMPSDMGWAYTINNMTTYVYGDTQWSDSDPVVNPGTIEVAAGDEIQIMVNTYDPENEWTAPAGELAVYASFTAVPGTVNNPIWLEIGENVLTIPAGATVYYCGRFGGMVMSAVGEGLTLEHNGTTYTLTAEAQAFTCAQASMWEPSTFVITNAGETELTCTLTVNYALGSMENPAALQIGSNTAVIEAGSQGYYYTWTAEEAGTLSIEMPSDMGWAYTINNMTTYVYGDTQWSDSDPVVNPGTIEVAAGDEIQIMVNTYDPADEWNNPAGELTFTVSFVTAEEPAAIVITSQPADQCVKIQTDGVFTVTAEGEGLSYRWEQSTDGSTWTKSGFTGNKTNTLTVTCYSSRQNMQFRCVITDANGNAVTSKAATLSILVEDFRIVTQPTVQSGNIGDYLYYTVEANDAYTYRWEISTDGGETWEKATYTGYNTNTMKVKLYFSRVNFLFRCEVKDALGNALVTDEVGINVVAEAVQVTQQPETEIAAYGTNAYFQVEAENAVAYRWQQSTDGGKTWTNTGDNVSGYNTKAMGIKALNSRDGWLFRCALTDGHGNVSYTEAAELKVASFTKQPEDKTVAAGESVTFSVAANYDVNYAWQYSIDGGETWQYASWTGADTAEMTVKAYASRSGWLFRCAITGTTSQPLYSNPVTLTVE